MASALVMSSGAAALSADLSAVGVEVRGQTDCSNLLQNLVRKSAEILVCFQETPDASFFASIAAVADAMPLPVIVFTTDPEADKMALAIASGVHTYVVDGYSRNRLRSVIKLAQARFRHENQLRQELSDTRKRFDERKLVDRAKGILMGARQLREQQAFRVLRSAAMASKRRIGQVSQIVIDSARYAEAVNRAGQLRMLSQRIVKFYALTCAGEAGPEARGMLDDSVAQIVSILAILDGSLSKATFGDLLESVLDQWAKLQTALKSRPEVSRLNDLDRLAERLLARAETLTANLEVAAFATVLHPINVAGRQRMLSQRLAKEVLMAALADAVPKPAGRSARDLTREELVNGLRYLECLPMTNDEIGRELQATNATWRDFQRALDAWASPTGLADIAASSETMLGHFDRLTDLIERGVHALIDR